MKTHALIENYSVKGGDPFVFHPEKWNKFLVDLVASIPMAGDNILPMPTPAGILFNVIDDGSDGSSSASFPFKVTFGGRDENDHPKINVAGGRVRRAASAGGADDNSVFASDYTFDGLAHPAFKVWVDLSGAAPSIEFGENLPLESTPNTVLFWPIATIEVTAESGEDLSEVTINQEWLGDIFMGELVDHTHSEEGDGGAAIDLPAAASFKVDDVEHIFETDDGYGLSANLTESP